MKRKAEHKELVPDYPTYKELHQNRRRFLGTLGMGLTGAALTSCSKSESVSVQQPSAEPIAGLMQAPGDCELCGDGKSSAGGGEKPKSGDVKKSAEVGKSAKGGKTAAKEVELPGKIKPPAESDGKPPARLRGKIKQPDPPKPKPPKKVEPVLGGDMVMPEPPDDEDGGELCGLMVCPDPPAKKP